MKEYRGYREPESPPAMWTAWGCLAWVLLSAACFASSIILILFVGSLIGELTGKVAPVFALGLGLLAAIFPVLILNSALTWLRQRWNRHARFRETFGHVLLIGNTVSVMLLVILAPGMTSRALKNHGNWPFGKETAALFGVDQQHVALRTGQKWVRRVAYLLEMEGNHLTPITTPPPRRAHTRQAKRPQSPAPTRTRIPAKRTSPLGRRILQPFRSVFRRQPPSPVRSRRPEPPPARPIRRVEPPAPPSAPSSSKTVRIRFHKQGNALVLPIRLQGYRTQILLDTGASFLTLSTRVVRRLGIQMPSNAPTLMLQTANGKIRAPVGMLRTLTLGRVTLRNVSFVLCNACADSQRRIVGLLGLNVLRRFLFTLDHQQGVILLQPQLHRRDRSADIRPFLTFQKLQGRTVRFFTNRVFSVKGLAVNRAELGIRNLKVRISYLRGTRILATRDFHLGPLRAWGRRSFALKDKKAPHFQRYRIELVHGEWVNAPR